MGDGRCDRACSVICGVNGREQTLMLLGNVVLADDHRADPNVMGKKEHNYNIIKKKWREQGENSTRMQFIKRGLVNRSVVKLKRKCWESE